MAKELHVGVGGAYKEATEVHIGVGGVWKDCSEVHVGVGGVWKQIYERISVNLDGQSISSINSPAGTAGVRVNSDGTVDEYKVESGYAQIDSATDWIIPNSAASAKTYRVKATVTAGTLTTGTTGSWILCSTSPEWRKTSSNGSSATITLEISDDGGTTTITSGSYTLIGDSGA